MDRLPRSLPPSASSNAPIASRSPWVMGNRPAVRRPGVARLRIGV